MPYRGTFIETLRSRQLGDNLSTDPDHRGEELRLVNSLVSSRKSEEQFSVNASTERFVKIVSSHSVIGQPGCPASLYMECAIMTVQLCFGSVETTAFGSKI